MQKFKAEYPFLWGVATSSHQIEGHNDKNDWWQWEVEGRIEGGVRSGAATDHWNRYKEDLRLAAELGLNSYRFSIEWSRIEPEEGRFDSNALKWYSDLITECEARGLTPMLTLHHFTSPQWLAAKGGFTWSEAPKKFAEFVKYVAREIGERVPLWCTLNEPLVLVIGTYIGKFMPPAEYSPSLASIACPNLFEAHVLAYHILHSEIRRPISVGIAHNMLDFLPDRTWHPMEQLLSRVFRRFYNRSWLDAVTGKAQRFGVTGLLPSLPPVQSAFSRKTVDFIGVNYYTKAYVQWRPRDISQEQPSELPLGFAFARRKEQASDLGWAVHPEGLGRMLRFASRYGVPLYVTENGIADRVDHLRPDYLRCHLHEIAKAISSGIDVRGYYHWSLLDNFEWIKGFGPRFGLYGVDYTTLERTPTHSAKLYQEFIAHHRRHYGGIPHPDYFGNRR